MFFTIFAIFVDANHGRNRSEVAGNIRNCEVFFKAFLFFWDGFFFLVLVEDVVPASAVGFSVMPLGTVLDLENSVIFKDWFVEYALNPACRIYV